MDIEITRKTDNKLVAYACPSCGILYSILSEGEDSRKAAQTAALACCPARMCAVCGKLPVDRGTTTCEACGKQSVIMAEQQRFAAAIRVPEAQWAGPVYWPNAPFTGDHGGFYWSSVATLRQDIGKRNASRTDATSSVVSLPPYVYATKPIPFRIDMNEVVLAALVDHSDSIVIDAAQVQGLQQQVDAWTKSQSVQSYEEDLGKAIVLG